MILIRPHVKRKNVLINNNNIRFMNIGFGNQKGGAGKTTLCILFANYLLAQQKPVDCYDFDLQSSLYHSYQILENRPNNATMTKASLSDAERILSRINESSISLFDLPPSLQLDHLPTLLCGMDVFIIPFLYEERNYASTLIFAKVMQHIHKEAKLFFVPNIVKTNVNYNIQIACDRELRTYGIVTPVIKDSVDFQRVKLGETNCKAAVKSNDTFTYISSLIL